MDLSIVAVNWNSVAYLDSCLTSVYRHVDGIDFEVIVVDNDSQDGCDRFLAQSFPEVRFIAAGENLGFARANNLGFKHSRGEVVLFLNPDTEIVGDALLRMHRWLRTNSQAGAAGPRLLNGDGSLQESCVQAFPTILNQVLDADALRRRFPAARLWGTQAFLSDAPNVVPVDVISGACYMVTRAAFEKVGGFSEEYFMYSDDVDLSYKLHRSGYEIAFLKDCTVLHYGGGSSSQRPTSFAAVQRRFATFQFLLRTRGYLYAAMYRLSLATSAIVRICAVLPALLFAATGKRREGLVSIVTRWSGILAWAVGLRMAVVTR